MHHQVVVAPAADGVRELTLPAPSEQVMPGVEWGHFDRLFTPAFWKTRVWLDEPAGYFTRYSLGETLEEEVAACLLGGYGIPAEIGLEAFVTLRETGMLTPPVEEDALEDVLRRPLRVGGRVVYYRFARTRARFVAESLNTLATMRVFPRDDRDFRDVLLGLTGVGLKTASWITRNWRQSDQVAIIDVHIHRAGIAAGVFPRRSSPTTDYSALEETFLAFAAALGTRASVLDNLIWQTVRRIGHLLRQ